MREQRKEELGSKPIGKLLLRYSAPATIGMIVNSLYNLVDAIFIGHGAGTLALAGLAISFSVQILVLAFGMMIGVGASSVFSRALGANEDERAERAAGTATTMVLVVSVVVTVFGLWFLDPILRLFGATEGILPYGRDYMSIILLGSVFYMFSVCMSSLVRAEGSAKTAMVSMIIGTGLNIILDPIFIFGFGMGISGAAIATVISMACSTLFLVWHYASGRAAVPLSLRSLRIDLEIMKETISVGSSSLMRMISASLLAIALNNSVAYYGSDIHLAAIGAINRLTIFLYMPMFGIVQGLLPILGFNYGARRVERVKQSLRLSIVTVTIYSSAVWTVLMLFAPAMLTMFSTDARLVSDGSHMLRILALMMPFVGFQMVGASMFQAFGKAKQAIFLSSARQLLFLLPLILLLPLAFRLEGVWYAFPVADLLAIAVTAVFYFVEYHRIHHIETVAESEPLQPVFQQTGE